MKKLLIISLLLFLPFVSNAAIVLDATSTSGLQLGTNTLSWNHSVGTGLSNSILIVTTGGGSGPLNGGIPQISTVTYGGSNLTKVANQTEGGAGNNASIWYLLNPTAGNATVTVTYTIFSGLSDDIQGGAFSLSGVNQTTPVDATSSSITSQTLNVTTTVAGDWLFDSASVGRGNSGRINGFGTGQTALYPASGTSTTQGASYKIVASAGATSTSFTNAGFVQYAYVNAAFKPASGGGVTTTVARRRGIVIVDNW